MYFNKYIYEQNYIDHNQKISNEELRFKHALNFEVLNSEDIIIIVMNLNSYGDIIFKYNFLENKIILYIYDQVNKLNYIIDIQSTNFVRTIFKFISFNNKKEDYYLYFHLIYLLILKLELFDIKYLLSNFIYHKLWQQTLSMIDDIKLSF